MSGVPWNKIWELENAIPEDISLLMLYDSYASVQWFPPMRQMLHNISTFEEFPHSSMLGNILIMVNISGIMKVMNVRSDNHGVLIELNLLS